MICSLMSRRQVYEKFKELPMDEIETWTLQTMEATKPTQRS